VVFKIVPRLMIDEDMNQLSVTMEQFAQAAMGDDLVAMDKASHSMMSQTFSLMWKVLKVAGPMLPFVALLTVLLLMYSNWAVRDRKSTKRPFLALAYISLVHVILACVKGVAFLFFVLPGVYIYVKTFFVSLIMLEHKKGAIAAIRISWKATDGHFWHLFFIIAINSLIQLVSAPTIIGLIPTTGFANTVRAAAYSTLTGDEDQAAPQAPPA